jgi:lipopolysaccharide export system protein LptC
MAIYRQDRISAAVSISLALTLAAGSFYLAHLADRLSGGPPGRVSGDQPDAYAEGVMLNRTGKSGEAAFLLTARRLEYFRGDDSTLLHEPVLTSLDTSQPKVILSARSGRASSGGGEVVLSGEVRLIREAGQGQPEMTIDTERAVVLPDSEIARTDLPVEIRRGTDRLTGTGMEFNNAARTLRVDSQVRASFNPGQQRQ